MGKKKLAVEYCLLVATVIVTIWLFDSIVINLIAGIIICAILMLAGAVLIVKFPERGTWGFLLSEMTGIVAFFLMTKLFESHTSLSMPATLFITACIYAAVCAPAYKTGLRHLRNKLLK